MDTLIPGPTTGIKPAAGSRAVTAARADSTRGETSPSAAASICDCSCAACASAAITRCWASRTTADRSTLRLLMSSPAEYERAVPSNTPAIRQTSTTPTRQGAERPRDLVAPSPPALCTRAHPHHRRNIDGHHLSHRRLVAQAYGPGDLTACADRSKPAAFRGTGLSGVEE